MEQVGETQPSKRSRISWKNVNVVKTFLETCIHEISINGREGGSLKTHSWTKVAETLKNNHNFIVDRKQMRNHHDYLKGKYGAWLKLTNKTGNVYDPSTNTFNLTDEEWESEIKQNKYVESLRTTTLPFPELCAKLFDGALATGVGSWGPTSNEPMADVEPDECEDDQEIEIQDAQQTTTSTPGCSSRPQVKKNKRKGKQQMSVIDEEIISVLKSLAAKQMSEPPPPPPPPPPPQTPTFDECLKKLDELEWGIDDPLYDVALAILSDQNDHYREAWMKIKPERLVNWVKMIGRNKGFM